MAELTDDERTLIATALRWYASDRDGVANAMRRPLEGEDDGTRARYATRALDFDAEARRARALAGRVFA